MTTIGANDVADSLSVLKLKLNSILDLFDPKSRIFYIDYPIHQNIGDLLINIGTEQFFSDHNIPIAKRYSILDHKKISGLKAGVHDTFLCHGGGNFGDLYPKHQNIRELLVERFPQSRIVFLPQSLHYSSSQAQAASLQKIAQNANCHVLVRDQESLNALRAADIVNSSLMPDMAHYLWGTISATAKAGSGKHIYFLRKDKESTQVPMELVDLFDNGSVDWNNIVTPMHSMRAKSAYYAIKAMNPILPSRVKFSLWYSARNALIRDAVDYFSSHDRVYANRLHAMILALLLGRDVVAFDNSYGKLSRYINTWLVPKS